MKRAATMKSHDTAALEAVRADTAQNAVADLTGKFEAIERALPIGCDELAIEGHRRRTNAF
jgi:hypothetical protein